MWNQIAKVERDRIVVTLSSDGGQALSLSIGSLRPDGSSGPFIRVFDPSISDKIKVLIDEALGSISDNRPPAPSRDYNQNYNQAQAQVPTSLSNQDKGWAQQQYERRRLGKDRNYNSHAPKRKWDDDE